MNVTTGAELTASGQAPAQASGATQGQWGFVVAVLTAVTAVVALVIGVLTPAHSGPYCRSDCVGYPYTGGAEFVPRDFWWQYPAILVALLAVVFMMVLPRRPSAHAALAARVAVMLATIAAGVLVTNYAIQLTVVQPSLLKKETLLRLGWRVPCAVEADAVVWWNTAATRCARGTGRTSPFRCCTSHPSRHCRHPGHGISRRLRDLRRLITMIVVRSLR